MDRLPVFLFDNDTDGIMVGESVIIKGEIEVIKNKTRYCTYLYGEAIQYLNREDFTLTKLDVEAIKRFRKLKGENKIIDQLVSMFDQSIVGYDHVKKGPSKPSEPTPRPARERKCTSGARACVRLGSSRAGQQGRPRCRENPETHDRADRPPCRPPP